MFLQSTEWMSVTGKLRFQQLSCISFRWMSTCQNNPDSCNVSARPYLKSVTPSSLFYRRGEWGSRRLNISQSQTQRKPQNSWLLGQGPSPAPGCLPIWFACVDKSTMSMTSNTTGPSCVFRFAFQSTMVLISILAVWTASNT